TRKGRDSGGGPTGAGGPVRDRNCDQQQRHLSTPCLCRMVSVRGTRPAPQVVGFQRAEEFPHMPGERLHKFDLQLCHYVLDNVYAGRGDPAFAAFLDEQLDAPALTYLLALASDDEPRALLLSDAELEDLNYTFMNGSFEVDGPWEPYEALHRRHID